LVWPKRLRSLLPYTSSMMTMPGVCKETLEHHAPRGLQTARLKNFLRTPKGSNMKADRTKQVPGLGRSQTVLMAGRADNSNVSAVDFLARPVRDPDITDAVTAAINEIERVAPTMSGRSRQLIGQCKSPSY
jgi:hypothetical protein